MVNGKLFGFFMILFAGLAIWEGVDNFVTSDHRINARRSAVLFAHPEWASAACIAFGLLLIYGGIRMWINDEE